jgi:hypothetical protein
MIRKFSQPIFLGCDSWYIKWFYHDNIGESADVDDNEKQLWSWTKLGILSTSTLSNIDPNIS